MSLIANSGLIRKAVFPAELLPMVSVLSNLVHFLFALPIVIAAIVAGRILGYPVGGLSVAGAAARSSSSTCRWSPGWRSGWRRSPSTSRTCATCWPTC